jgi:hypothetical protein
MKVVCGNTLDRARGHSGYSFRHKKEIHIEIKDDKYDKTIYPRLVDYSKRRRYYTTDNYMYSEELKQCIPKPGYKEIFAETGYLPQLLLSKEERTVNTIAHELRHQWQRKRRPISEWTYGTNKGKHTKVGIETDASAYAIKMVRQWRRLHAVNIYREQPDKIPFCE